MIDIKLIRDNPEVVYQSMEKRGEGRAEVDEIIELDGSYRLLLKGPKPCAPGATT